MADEKILVPNLPFSPQGLKWLSQRAWKAEKALSKAYHKRGVESLAGDMAIVMLYRLAVDADHLSGLIGEFNEIMGEDVVAKAEAAETAKEGK